MVNHKAEEAIVDQIMDLMADIPRKPDPTDVMAAEALIRNVSSDEQLRLEEISEETKPKDVPDELFAVYQEMQRRVVRFQFEERKKEAMSLVDLSNTHKVLDDLMHRAAKNVSPVHYEGEPPASPSAEDWDKLHASMDKDKLRDVSYRLFFGRDRPVRTERPPIPTAKDDSYVDKGKGLMIIEDNAGGDSSQELQDSSTTNIGATSSSDPAAADEKLGFVKFASLMETYAKQGNTELNVRGKLTADADELPRSVRKLSSLVTLDVSENLIRKIPPEIRGLSSLERFNLRSNRIDKLPETIGDLSNLVVLDLSGNNLEEIPVTLGRLVNLVELELNTNMLKRLPETIGSLVSLRKLTVETNNLGELPYTIGLCTSLRELRVDYNKLRALPEAVGRIGSLEIISARYNSIRQLPSTMQSTKLREVNASFNEIDFVPDRFCFATSIVRLNLSNNFANLQELPLSIGNLELLEELDISNNQIRRLPGTLRHCTRLTTLKLDHNPLESPPIEIVERGPQAVIEYLNYLAASMDPFPERQRRKSWAQKIASKLKKKEPRGGVVIRE